jgi:hypothetical protein
VTNVSDNVTKLHSSRIASYLTNALNLETKSLFRQVFLHYITSFRLLNYLPFWNNKVTTKIWSRRVLEKRKSSARKIKFLTLRGNFWACVWIRKCFRVARTLLCLRKHILYGGKYRSIFGCHIKKFDLKTRTNKTEYNFVPLHQNSG